MKIYIGPYVKVKVPLIEQPEFSNWCSTCDKLRGSTKFCQDCGSLIVLKERISLLPSPNWTVPHTIVLRYSVSNDFDDYHEYVFTVGNGYTDFNERQEDEEELKLFWYGTKYYAK